MIINYLEASTNDLGIYLELNFQVPFDCSPILNRLYEEQIKKFNTESTSSLSEAQSLTYTVREGYVEYIFKGSVFNNKVTLGLVSYLREIQTKITSDKVTTEKYLFEVYRCFEVARIFSTTRRAAT